MREEKRGSPGVLLLGASYRALGAARSLGRRGIPVWILRSDDHVTALSSKYVSKSLDYPRADSRVQVDALKRLAAERGLQHWTLMPSDDESAALVARNAEALAEHYVLAVPPWHVTRWAYDKRLMHELATKVKVGQPRTAVAPSANELEPHGADMGYPVVVKPAFKADQNPLTTAKAWRADSPEELAARYGEALRFVPPELLMVQEFIPGSGESQLSYAALCRDGEVVASLAANRLRQRPMQFGKASSYVETVPQSSELAEPARRLLAAICYTGIVEVEFKRDCRDGELKLLDINPRIWGWITLCEFAGIDFVLMYWRMLRGESLPSAEARPGVRWVRTYTDVPTALQEIGAGRLSLHEYLDGFRGPLAHALWDRADPLPALLELPRFAWVAARRFVARRRLAARYSPRGES